MRHLIIYAVIVLLLSACFSPGVGGGGPELPISATCPPCPGEDATQTPVETHEKVPTTVLSTPVGIATQTIIEVTPLGGFSGYVGVAEFTVETVVRVCQPDAIDLLVTPQSKSPAAYCKTFLIDGYNVTVKPGFATDIVGFYKVNNGELWGVVSYKDGRVIALCYHGASRAKVWLNTVLYELDLHPYDSYKWQYACAVNP